MFAFAFYKWLGFKFIDEEYQNNRGACGHRDCWDCCMWRAFREYNWTQTLLFIASGGWDAAAQGLACIEDCYIFEQ